MVYLFGFGLSPTLSKRNHLLFLLALKHKDYHLILIFVVGDNFLVSSSQYIHNIIALHFIAGLMLELPPSSIAK